MEQTGNIKDVGQAVKFRKKVALLKRMGHFDDPHGRIHVRRAIAEHDLRIAYRLVHDAFVEKGYISPKPGGIRLRAFEAVPEMATFVAAADTEVVGVMSIVPDSPDLGLPSDAAFNQELDELRRAKRRVAEVSNLAIVPKYRRSCVFTELARAIHAHAVVMGYDDVFIAISPGHAGFFQDILQFDPWGDARDYSAEKEDIVVGMRWNLQTLEDRFREADETLEDDALLIDHFYQNNVNRDLVRPWAIMAKRAFLKPQMLHNLFVKDRTFLDDLAPSQREAIRRRWGDALYAEVCNSHRPELTPV